MKESMSYKLDYDEEMPEVIARLLEEHREIDNKLSRIAGICRNYEDGKLHVAMSLLKSMSEEILRHAVEEEAIVARAIMRAEATKNSSNESITILQDHRRIKEFLEDKLPYLPHEASERKARKEVLNFVNELTAHHRAEEEIVFPLAQKADMILSK
jgi:iron-sulfur cluster repair protein YtfE (RIC family)